jgi:hypothetical protein
MFARIRPKMLLIFLSGLLLVAKFADASALDQVGVSEFVMHIAFTLDAKHSARTCHVPAVLDLQVSRHHPVRETRFTPVKGSPYKSVIVLSSDVYKKTAVIRHYTDRVLLKDSSVEIILRGEKNHAKNINSGKWSNNVGCRGYFTEVNER